MQFGYQRSRRHYNANHWMTPGLCDWNVSYILNLTWVKPNSRHRNNFYLQFR